MVYSDPNCGRFTRSWCFNIGYGYDAFQVKIIGL